MNKIIVTALLSTLAILTPFVTGAIDTSQNDESISAANGPHGMPCVGCW
jgi:hypothetical protein